MISFYATVVSNIPIDDTIWVYKNTHHTKPAAEITEYTFIFLLPIYNFLFYFFLFLITYLDED